MFLPPLFKRLLALIWGLAFFTFGLFQRTSTAASSSASSLASFLQDFELDSDASTTGLRRQTAATPFVRPGPQFLASSNKKEAQWEGKKVAFLSVEQKGGEEIEGAVAQSLLQQGLQTRFFRSSPLGEDYLNAFASFWPAPSFESIEDGKLEKALRSNEIDLLILSSCDSPLSPLLPSLANSKVHLTCLLTHSSAFLSSPTTFLPLAKEGRLSLVTFSQRIGERLVGSMDDLAEKDQESAWEKVGVETFVPVYPNDRARSLQAAKIQPHAFPSKVAVYGEINNDRRHYTALLSQLATSIQADPFTWGWQLVGLPQGGTKLEPLKIGREPFELHLIGKVWDELVVPEVLEEVITIHRSPSLEASYDLLGSMDLLLPAFSHPDYFTSKTSASLPSAFAARLPSLVSPRLVDIYPYLSGPAAVVYPNSMGEVEALRRLRTGEDLMDGMAVRTGRKESASWAEVEEDVEKSNGEGWKRILSRA